MKKNVTIPVIVAGRIDTPILAERILEEGKADFIAMGRPLLADPDLPQKAMEGRDSEIRRCIYCHSCRRDPPPEGLPIICMVNPEIGVEFQTEVAAPRPKRVLIIGGGPAGLEAARVARLRGHEVTLWEESPALGGRWSWLMRACIPERVRVLKGLGVTVEVGKLITAETVAAIQPDVVLATPRAVLPPLPIVVRDGVDVAWANEVLDEGREVSGKVVVLGTGNIGCEVAHSLSHHEVEVTIIGGDEKLGYGLEPTTATVLVEQLRHRGVQFRMGLYVKCFQENRVYCQDGQGRGVVAQADACVLAFQLAEPLPQPPAELAMKLQTQGLEVYSLPYCDQPGYAIRAVRIGASVARQI